MNPQKLSLSQDLCQIHERKQDQLSLGSTIQVDVKCIDQSLDILGGSNALVLVGGEFKLTFLKHYKNDAYD